MQDSTFALLSREQSREIDRRAINEYGIPSIVLMENAGRKAAEYILDLKINSLVVICCGKGNNAGDGFVIARHLDNQHIRVQVLLFTNPTTLTPDARINYEILMRSGIAIKHIAADISQTELSAIFDPAEYVIDALFGTGLQGTAQPPFDKIIATMNSSAKKIIAIDIPSGLDCDSDEPLGIAVKAQHTLTFVATKKSFASPSVQTFLGKVTIIDIGIPRKLIEEFLRHRF